MKTRYDEICIIYNPHSTGDSKKDAQAFYDAVAARKPDATLHLRATKHPGHASSMARAYARSGKHVLVVSSSGDGGYNEVINGALASTRSNVVTYVLPSGNANDHHHATSTQPNIRTIITRQPTAIDVIRVASTINGKRWVQYAHSYVGIGATSVIGRKITSLHINFFNEKMLVLKKIFQFRYVMLERDKKVRKYSSIIYTTIPRMSKIMHLAKNTSVRDGTMELYTTPYRSPWHLVGILLKAITVGLDETSRTASDTFRTVSKTSIQCDGEVFVLDPKATVKITCEKQRLSTIL